MQDNKIIHPFPTEPDDRPLPERIASLYRFKLQKCNVDDDTYYAVQDWIFGIVPHSDIRKMWSAIKRRHNQLSTRCRQLPYVASDGKTYQMDFADAETLYLITQRMQANSGNRDAILLYLAKAGVKLDELINNPDKAEEMFAELADEKEYRKLINEGFSNEEAMQWVQVRHNQKKEWNIVTSSWGKRGVEGFEYARLTNDVQEVATGITATEAKNKLGITKTSREYLSASENASISITGMTSRLLHEQRGSKGVDELSEDIYAVKPIIDAARPEIEKVFSKKRRRLPEGNPKGTA